MKGSVSNPFVSDRVVALAQRPAVKRARTWLANALLHDVHLAVVHFGEHTVTMASDKIAFSATPTFSAEGDFGYDTTAKRFNFRDNAATRTLPRQDLTVLRDGTQALTADWDVGGFKVTNAAQATADAGFVTLAQCRNEINKLDSKPSARFATTAALDAFTESGGPGIGKRLTKATNGALTVDGIAAAVNDRGLVKNEATAARHGLYKVIDAGSGTTPWIIERAVDFDEAAEVTSFALVGIEEGTINGNTTWRLTTTGAITVDTTGLTFNRYDATFDHGNLVGLADDDHSQYVAKDGRAGGQTVKGGTAASENITITSTNHATKGTVILGATGDKVRLDVAFDVNGDLSILPVTDNQGELGNATKRFRLIRGFTVTSGDHVFDDGKNVYRVFEGSGGLLIEDQTPGSRTRGRVSRMMQGPARPGPFRRAAFALLGLG